VVASPLRMVMLHEGLEGLLMRGKIAFVVVGVVVVVCVRVCGFGFFNFC